MKQLLIVIAALVGMGMLPSAANAFCVYNKASTTVGVLEYSGGKPFKGFVKNLGPGQSACCNWQTGDCNTAGKQDSNLIFKASFEGGHVPYLCGSRPASQLSRLLGSEVTYGMEAGGWTEFHDSGDPNAPYKAQIYTHGGSLSYTTQCKVQ